MGGKKKPKSPTIVADNLYNQDMVELVFGICEGTIEGLANGLRSLYVNEIPMISETGDYNFQDIGVNFRQGYMDDLPIKYLMGGEGSVMSSSLSVSLPADVPRTFITPPEMRGQIKSIDIRILVSQLYSGDGQNVYESSVIYQVGYRKVGEPNWRYVSTTSETLNDYKRKVETLRQAAVNQGLNFDTMTEAQRYDFELKTLKDLKNVTDADLIVPNITYQPTKYFNLWSRTVYLKNIQSQQAVYLNQINGATVNDINENMLIIKGKTSAGYVHELTIPIFDIESDNHDWEIKVVRRSKELTSEELKYSGKTILLESISLITDNEKTYPKTAICQVVAQHTDRFDDIPDFTAEIKGMICDVPDTYNPYNKTWANGIWTGGFKKGWTDNNALIARELIMNRDWGKRATEPQLQVDNASLREAITYCDELVPDLDGNMKPRHTFNDVISAERDIDDYLKYVLGSFHASSREIFGVYRFFIDRPKIPSFFVSSATVFQSGFMYNRSDLSSRFNTIRTVFINANNNYQEDRRILIDEAGQIQNGIIPYTYQAVGATNLSEAIRQAVYLMYTNKEETIFVTFSQPRLGHVVDLYDHFYLFDPDLDWGIGMRIVSYNPQTYQIKLRDALDIEHQFCDLYYHTDYGVNKATVYITDKYTLSIHSAESYADCAQYLVPDAPIGLGNGTYGHPATFRILSIEQSDSADMAQGELFVFKAAIVSPLKYEAVDNINDPNLVNFKFNSVDTTYDRDRIPTKPYNVSIWLEDKTNALDQFVYGITFSAEIKAAKYKVQWINKNTGEQRGSVLTDTAGSLAPAFDEATNLSLKITPYSRDNVAGEALIMDYVQLTQAKTNGLPRFISADYYAPTNSIRFTFTQQSFSAHTNIVYGKAYVDSERAGTKITNQEVNLNITYYDIPYVGEGTYSMSLRFEALGSQNNGYTEEQATQTWVFYGDNTGGLPVTRYPTPMISAIKSYTNTQLAWTPTTAPSGKVFIEALIVIPNYQDYPELASNNSGYYQPFVFTVSDDNDGVFRRIGQYVAAQKVSGQVGVFKALLEFPESGSFQGDATKVGANFRVKVVDQNGFIEDEPDWICNSRDSNWASVLIPSPV